MKIKYEHDQNGQAVNICGVPDGTKLVGGEKFAPTIEIVDDILPLGYSLLPDDGGGKRYVEPIDITPELIESLHTTDYLLQEKIDKQNVVCRKLLAETDYKMLQDSPYSLGDTELCGAYRAELRLIISGGVLASLPPKPFDQ